MDDGTALKSPRRPRSTMRRLARRSRSQVRRCLIPYAAKYLKILCKSKSASAGG